jgi:hypothetical protein
MFNRMENGRWYCANGPNLASLLRLAQPHWAGGPSRPNRGSALGQRRRWRRPCRLRLASGGDGKGGALGRHGDVVNSIRGQQGGVAHRGNCSTAVGGRPEGNGGGGGVRGRWSTARSAGRWYTVARCSWRLWGPRRGTRGSATWWLDGGRTRQRSGGDRREEERLFTGDQALFIAGRGGGRRAARW